MTIFISAIFIRLGEIRRGSQGEKLGKETTKTLKTNIKKRMRKRKISIAVKKKCNQKGRRTGSTELEEEQVSPLPENHGTECLSLCGWRLCS